MPAVALHRFMLVMLVPGLALLLTFLFRHDVSRLVSVNAIIPVLPYLLVAGGMLLAWSFNNGREFNLLCVIGLGYWALREYLWLPNLPADEQSLLYAGLCVLLPFNFLLHDALHERGVLRWQFLKRISLTILQIVGIAALLSFEDERVQEMLRKLLWKTFWSQPLTLTQPGIITASLAAVILSIRLGLQLSPLRGATLMSVIALTLALNSITQPEASSVYFSIAAGAVVIALLIHSYTLAYFDELTQLPSRRALKQHLMALGKRYSIAMIDIDHFKKLNDSYGHAIGDQVLRMVAAQLATVENGGIAFRYGGEEFTILFPNKTAHEAQLELESLRTRIAETPFYLRHRARPKHKPDQPVRREKVAKLNVTVSIGVAERDEHHLDPMVVIKSADQALYSAKRAGRNRVQRYTR